MRERFLAGGEADPRVDYPRIDGDASLDDHWGRLRQQDAEDRRVFVKELQVASSVCLSFAPLTDTTQHLPLSWRVSVFA